MRLFYISAFLVRMAFSKAYSDYNWTGAYQPYQNTPNFTFQGNTSVNDVKERVASVEIFKGANGCISGAVLNSLNGTQTIQLPGNIATTRAPPPGSCSTSTQCLNQSLSASYAIVEVNVTANNHSRMAYGCIDSIFFKATNGISFFTFGCDARAGTPFQIVNNPAPNSPKVYSFTGTNELRVLSFASQADCMINYIEVGYIDPCLPQNRYQSAIALDISNVDNKFKSIFSGSAEDIEITASSTCNDVEYKLAVRPQPPYLIYLQNATPPQYIRFSQSSAVQNFTLQLKARFYNQTSYTYVSQNVTFKYINPCLTTTITATGHQFFTGSVLASSSSSSASWFDGVSGSAASQLCGPFTISVTKSITPSTYNDTTMGSHFTWTNTSSNSILTVSPTQKEEIGNYVFTFTICLTNYTTVTCQSFNSTFEIIACVVTAFDMIDLSPTYDATYTIADAVMQISIPLAGLTTSVPACGYDQEPFQLIATSVFQSPATFEISSSASTNIIIDVYTRNLANAGEHTIELISTLKNYSPYAGAPTPSVSKTLNLKVVDPCLQTQITADPSLIENLVSFAGYTTKSLIKYTLKDTVSIQNTLSTDFDDFCGDKAFFVKFNGTLTDWLSVDNQDYITFSPPQDAVFGETDITIQIESYPSINSQLQFFVTTLRSIVPTIVDQTYLIGTSPLLIEYDSFIVLPQTYDIGLSKVQGFIYDGVVVPNKIELPSSQLTSIQDLDWITLHSDDCNFIITTENESLAGTYQIVLVQSFENFNQVYPFTYFKLTLDKVIKPQITQTPYLKPELKDQVVEQCQNITSSLWQYTLPDAVDPSQTEVNFTVFFDKSFFTFSNATNTITQKELVTNDQTKTIKVTLTNEFKMHNTFTMTVQFTCKVTTPQSVAQSYQKEFDSLVQQTTWPSARVHNIEPNGVVHIRFNQTMRVPENPQLIQNETITLNGTVYPVFQIQILPGNLSDAQMLKFNWTFINFTTTELTIKLYFENMLYVSSHCLDHDAIKITIYGLQLFKSSLGQFMRIPYELTPKSLPQFTTESDLLQAQETTNIVQTTIVTVMVVNTVVCFATSGPLQIILEQVQQLQLMIHVLLIGVAYPASATMFFAMLMQLLTFQVIDFEVFYNKLLKLDPDSNGNRPLNDLFGNMGYGSLYIVQNFGPLCLTVFITPIMCLVSLILTRNFKGKFINLREKQTRLMFYDGWLSLISETFLFLSVCAGLNLYYNYSWRSFGDGVNTLCSLVTALVIVVFVLFVAIFYRMKRSKKRFKARDQDFIARFGSFLSQFNIIQRRHRVFVYKTFSHLRKLWLAYVVVAQVSNPVYSIIQVNFQSLIMMYVIGFSEPFKNKLANMMELVNEAFVLIFTYHMYTFTDFMPYLENRVLMGKILVYLAIFNIALNIIVAVEQNVFRLLFLTKLLYKRIQNRRQREKAEQKRREAQEKVLENQESSNAPKEQRSNNQVQRVIEIDDDWDSGEQSQSQNQTNTSQLLNQQHSSQRSQTADITTLNQSSEDSLVQVKFKQNLSQIPIQKYSKNQVSAELPNRTLLGGEQNLKNGNPVTNQEEKSQNVQYQKEYSIDRRLQNLQNQQSQINRNQMPANQVIKQQGWPKQSERFVEVRQKYAGVTATTLKIKSSDYGALLIELIEVRVSGKFLRYNVICDGTEYIFQVGQNSSLGEQIQQQMLANDHLEFLRKDFPDWIYQDLESGKLLSELEWYEETRQRKNYMQSTFGSNKDFHDFGPFTQEMDQNEMLALYLNIMHVKKLSAQQRQ